MVVSRSFYLFILLFAAFETSLILGKLQSARGETAAPFLNRPLSLLTGLLADGVVWLAVFVSASRVTVVELEDPDGYGAVHRRWEYKVYGTPELVTPLKNVVSLDGIDIKPFRRYLVNHTDRTFLLYPIEYANIHTHPKYYKKPDGSYIIGPGECLRIRYSNLPDYWFRTPPHKIDGIPLDDTGLPRTVIMWAIRECEPPVRDSAVVSHHEDRQPTRTGLIVNKKKWLPFPFNVIK